MGVGTSFSTIERSLKISEIASIESAKRIQYNNSLWHSIVHFREKRLLNRKIESAVHAYFQEQYQITDASQFSRLWKWIAQKEWPVHLPLTMERLHAIHDAFNRQLLYHGPGIFTSKPVDMPSQGFAVRQIVNMLLHGGSLSHNALSSSLLRTIFFRSDPVWLRQYRVELQRELNQLAENPPKNEHERILWDAFRGYVLALLPYGYPIENEIYTIPYLNASGSCCTAQYKANIILLNPSDISTSVSVVGLLPCEDKQAPPILSFLGTTYPAGNGFVATIKADFTPKMSVGAALYMQGKEAIAAWLEGKENVYLTGASLGGSLTFHTLIDHHEKLSGVDVYNPPGLYAECWKQRVFHQGCPITIYRQSGDLVCKMGLWPVGKKVKIIHLIPHQKGISEGIFTSHALAFSGCRMVSFLLSNPSIENQERLRRILISLHRYIGPYVFYYPISLALSCYRASKGVLDALKKWRHGLCRTKPL